MHTEIPSVVEDLSSNCWINIKWHLGWVGFCWLFVNHVVQISRIKWIVLENNCRIYLLHINSFGILTKYAHIKKFKLYWMKLYRRKTLLEIFQRSIHLTLLWNQISNVCLCLRSVTMLKGKSYVGPPSRCQKSIHPKVFLRPYIATCGRKINKLLQIRNALHFKNWIHDKFW